MTEKSPSTGWKETYDALEVSTNAEETDPNYGSDDKYDLDEIDRKAEFMNALYDGSAARSSAVLGDRR